jgi:hypothetical protein
VLSSDVVCVCVLVRCLSITSCSFKVSKQDQLQLVCVVTCSQPADEAPNVDIVLYLLLGLRQQLQVEP